MEVRRIKKFFKSIDFITISIIFALFCIGIVALYSAGGGLEGDSSEASKQLIWFGVGFVLMLIIMSVDYEVWGKLWIYFYAFMILMLFLVLFTEPINGATSWFNIGSVSIQPSEFSKIILIVGLAKVLTYFSEKKKINKFSSLLVILSIVVIPILLIAKQPDYGTAMVLLVISFIMIFSAGISLWYIFGTIIAGAASLPLIYLYVLPSHAKARIEVFLNPQLDPLGAGYNIIQSMLAVGSGQMWGMGLFNGNQTQLGYLPMRTTDFIYSVIGEEMGFVISLLVVVLFVLLIVRIFFVAKKAKDLFGTLVAVGIGSLFLAHFIENVGMTIGLMPITGIPLPFVSYGGSSMITNFIAIGILLSINRKRKRNMFLE